MICKRTWTRDDGATRPETAHSKEATIIGKTIHNQKAGNFEGHVQMRGYMLFSDGGVNSFNTSLGFVMQFENTCVALEPAN